MSKLFELMHAMERRPRASTAVTPSVREGAMYPDDARQKEALVLKEDEHWADSLVVSAAAHDEDGRAADSMSSTG